MGVVVWLVWCVWCVMSVVVCGVYFVVWYVVSGV